MANQVYANNNEVACKAAAGKSICAFPDVCMTPPENPATPPGVPVPYPNTGMASDTTEGSRSVQISGEEVMLKNKSYFKTSYGDEAGCAAKKGLLTSSNKGKVYFIAWSMDVKIEGENVDRHLDMTTHNHASPMANEAAPMVYVDAMAFELPKSCAGHVKENDTSCAGAKPTRKAVRAQDTGAVKKGAGGSMEWRSAGVNCDAAKNPKACKKARACLLMPKDQDKDFCCKEDTTGHHLIEVHCFSPRGMRGHPMEGSEGYKEGKAPTVCASESRSDGTHGLLHAVQSKIEGHYNANGAVICEWSDPGKQGRQNVSKWRYKHARDAGVFAHQLAHPHCSEDCIKDQLDQYHKDEAGCGENTPLRTDPDGEDHATGTMTKSQKAAVADFVDGL